MSLDHILADALALFALFSLFAIGYLALLVL